MQHIAKISGLRIGIRPIEKPPTTKVVRRNATKTFIAWKLPVRRVRQNTKK
ncbi:MAG: hypothetical protein QOJ66_170 [Ilumatobacteraceae bacterium]